MLKKERKIPLEIDVHFILYGKNHGKLIMTRNTRYVM